ncbi:MAG: PAS domain S-box protein [Candidatus Cloacimonadota bacterium]|nr:MAG: PAS domain S-box protein [Candidatus Cloacimonadota bacterium]
MKDKNKTKEQLINELVEARRRVAEFEKLETDRKRAEKALKKREEQYQDLYDHAPDMYFSIKPDGTMTSVNQYGAEYLGYSKEELIGEPVWKIVHNDNLKRVKKQISEIFSKKLKKSALEFHKVRKDGSTIWVQGRTQLIFDEDGEPKELRVICRDISEREKAEKALRESEKQYRTLQSNIPVGVFRTSANPGGRILSANPALAKMFGYKKPEAMSKVHVGDLYLNPDDRKRFIKTLSSSGEISNYEVQLKRKDGTVFWGSLNARAIADEKGEILYFDGVLGDITERKQAKEALRESERRYRSLVETIQEGMCIVDTNENIIFANPWFSNILGYSQEEIIGMNLRELISSEEELQKILQGSAKRKNRVSSQYETVMRRKDGELRNIRVSATPWINDKKEFQGTIGMVMDITEQKRAAEALRLSEEKYRTLIDNIQDGVFIIQDAEMKFANEAFARMVGYTVEEIIGMDFRELIAPEDSEMVADRYHRRQAGEDIPREYEFCMLHKDRVTRVIVNMNVGVINYRGKIASMGTMKDITERKRAEEELKRSFWKLQRTLEGTVNALASTVEKRDLYTAGHQRRVTQLACAIAKEMGLSEEKIEGIRVAGILHDIGKVHIAAEILNKPIKLSEIEMVLVKTHAQVGYDILKTVEFSSPVAQTVLQHHERLDGSGYPQGLSGDEILVEAKILAVADVVEAMSSHRPYRPAYSINTALEEISENRGILYAPEVVDACLIIFKERGFEFELI